MHFNERTFTSEEDFRRALLQELEERVLLANDPNTKWISEEEFDADVEAYLCELEKRMAAKANA